MKLKAISDVVIGPLPTLIDTLKEPLIDSKGERRSATKTIDYNGMLERPSVWGGPEENMLKRSATARPRTRSLD